MKNELKDITSDIPATPGVYKFLDVSGSILYIGKAKNLRRRVGSYFSKSYPDDSKTAMLVASIASVDFIEVRSEVEALILEAYLIGKHKPFYNIVLKDDRSFLYIEIIRERLPIRKGSDSEKKVLLPKLRVSRKGDLQPSSIVFGPFPSSSAARFVLRTLRKFFPYRDCSKNKFVRYSGLGRPCLYGDLGLCSAPCVGKISPTQYRKQISRISSFLEGRSGKLLEDLEASMKDAASRQDYEVAKEYKDMLARFSYVREKRIPAELYAQRPDLVQDLARQGLEHLREALPVLKVIPQRIECYDISDLSGSDAVGSMVVAVDGVIRKDLYKKFRIKETTLPDDVSRMQEVLTRRLNRGLSGDPQWELPQLLVVDGGVPQVSGAHSILSEFSQDVIASIDLVGIAKKEETLVYYESGSYREIKLPSDSPGMRLLLLLRNEAHRFAQSYHHYLRTKDLKSDQ